MRRRRRATFSKTVNTYHPGKGIVFSCVILQVCNVPMGRDVVGAMRVPMAQNVFVSTLFSLLFA